MGFFNMGQHILYWQFANVSALSCMVPAHTFI